jgi:hypothetical protein
MSDQYLSVAKSNHVSFEISCLSPLITPDSFFNMNEALCIRRMRDARLITVVKAAIEVEKILQLQKDYVYIQ